MDSPTIAPPLAGQVLGSQDNSFVIAEWQDAGAPPGPPRWIAPKHVHHKDDEAWYVLEGVLGVLVGDKEVEARTGAAVMVPRGTPHTYWNAGAGRLRYLLVMTANIHQLIQDIHALKEKTPATLKEVFRKHDSELL
ncbi:MAG TPA: cupin domain-containing protein [Terriglobales bacterium]|jgi:mannose-6-phosphate isomerase-like protein (cupin superfamily)